MGRRPNQITLIDAPAAQKAAMRQLRVLMSRFDFAQMEAQTHAVDMVQILAGFARDMNQPVQFRRDCANDVLDRGYGKVATKAPPEVVNPTPEGGDGEGDEIIAIRATAELYQRLDDLVRRGVPPDEWPDDVRQIAGGLAASYEENPA